MTKIFKGVIPPVPTLFKDYNTLDKEGMKKLIDFLIKSKVNGLIFLGSSGEFSQISLEFRKYIAEFVINYVNKRIPILIGTGCTNTNNVITLSNHAYKQGADGVLIVNPYYNKLTEDNLYEHYAQIAENIDLPIVLYNFPELTGQDLSPALVKKLAKKHSNIVGIKETIDSTSHIRSIIFETEKIRKDFSVLAGYDDHQLNTLAIGGDGVIPGSANFAPELSVELYNSFIKGDYKKAINNHLKISKLIEIYRLDTPFINVIKKAIKLRGIDIETLPLPPSKPLSDEKVKILDKIIKNIER